MKVHLQIPNAPNITPCDKIAKQKLCSKIKLFVDRKMFF